MLFGYKGVFKAYYVFVKNVGDQMNIIIMRIPIIYLYYVGILIPLSLKITRVFLANYSVLTNALW